MQNKNLAGLFIIFNILFFTGVATQFESIASPAQATTQDYHPALSFKAVTTSGVHVSMDSLLQGNDFMIMNLWATWCKPCVEEIPILNQLQATFRNEHIAYIALSCDKDKSAALTFLQKHDFNYILIHQDDVKGSVDLWKLFCREGNLDGPQLLPITVLYNRKLDTFKIERGAFNNQAEADLSVSEFFNIKAGTN